MTKSNVLIIDLTEDGGSVERNVATRYAVRAVRNPLQIPEVMSETTPFIVCFEFDYPDHNKLSLLTTTKRSTPSIPIIMVTEQHSEALAVWALRSRVWDYFVKPVDREHLLSSVSMLARLIQPETREKRSMVLPPIYTPMETRINPNASTGRRARIAAEYVKRHLHERIREEEVAECCGMTRYQFSRYFHQAHGTTFQEFLLKTRIEEAARLLQNPNASITDVCWTVGFRDTSHFSRMFRRRLGMPPSQYRQQFAERRQALRLDER